MANVTLRSGTVLREARVIGAGNGSDRGIDLYIDHATGRDWFNTEDMASIVWTCGKPNFPEDADEWCGLAPGHSGGCAPVHRDGSPRYCGAGCPGPHDGEVA